MERVRSKKRITQTLDCEGSSNLVAARYHTRNRELQVDFKGGATYAYEGVTPEHWAGMRKASSKGAYLAAEIKPNYPAHKLEVA